MAKGAEAKKVVGARLIEAFGADYICEQDGKHYVWAKDGADRVQICISMTCPKNQVGETASTNELNFVNEPPRAEVSAQEQENIANLLRSLGL